MQKKRNFARAKDASHIIHTLEVLGITETDLSIKLGVSPGAVHTWIKQDSPPKYTELACKGLLSNHITDDAIYIAFGDRDKFTTVESFLNAMGVQYKKVK